MGSDRGAPALTRHVRQNFNPRSPGGERLGLVYDQEADFLISIHVPRVGSDPCSVFRGVPDMMISIHVPRVGSDQTGPNTTTQSNLFQSTLPGWGATSWCRFCCYWSMNFNPRSPDGERRQARAPQRNQIYFNPRSPDGERPELENSWLHMSRISIHAPRMGSDRRGSGSPSASVRFQSTLPGWGATGCRSIGMVRW